MGLKPALPLHGIIDIDSFFREEETALDYYQPCELAVRVVKYTTVFFKYRFLERTKVRERLNLLRVGGTLTALIPIKTLHRCGTSKGL